MADLSSKKREKMPAKDFGLPEMAHARNPPTRSSRADRATTCELSRQTSAVCAHGSHSVDEPLHRVVERQSSCGGA